MRVLTECNLAELVVKLLQGETVVFPTETSYGLGCDAQSQAAVDRIFKIKGRSDDKPLLIVVDSVEEAKKYLIWNEVLDQLAKRYWPGPLTIVGKAKPTSLAKGVVAKDQTVAIRVSADNFLKSVTQKMGRPLVATSANLADQGNNYSADVIINQFKDLPVKPDIILNHGELPKRVPTTLVTVVEGSVRVLRQGELKVEL